MYVDILIFAAIAGFLVHRLMSVLGTRTGAERERRNPFAPGENLPGDRKQNVKKDAEASGLVIDMPLRPAAAAPLAIANIDQLIDPAANVDGRIETGLAEIAAADPAFELNGFVSGARMAFEMIVTAYNRGDLATLKPLLSPKLYNDFAAGIRAREEAGHKSEVIIHRISAARVAEAHLGGTMAYVTVDFDVEETTVTRDAAGQVIDGNPDRIFSVEDIWTFTRDIRARDPNWMLIETRSVEKDA